MTPLLAPSSRQDLQRMPLRKARLANSISQGVRRNPSDGGTPEFLPHRFQIIHFAGATLASPEVQLASQRIRRVQFSVEESVQDEFPIRTGAGRAHAGFGAGGEIMTMRTMSLSGTLARWLDDDFAFHVRVDRAQILIVARGCKSERELASLARVFDRTLVQITTVWGMASLLTQVTVVPGTTVISPGMKCYGPCSRLPPGRRRHCSHPPPGKGRTPER